MVITAMFMNNNCLSSLTVRYFCTFLDFHNLPSFYLGCRVGSSIVILYIVTNDHVKTGTV